MNEHPALRTRLYILVQDYPGLHMRELARRLGSPVRMVEYHAGAMLKEGLLEEQREGTYQRLFPNRRELPLPTKDRAALGLLRKPVPLGIVLALLDAPTGLTHGDLTRRIEASKANATHHLKALQDLGLITHAENLYRISQPDRIRTLLRAHKPVPDLRTRFADPWSSIYRLP